MKISQTNNTRSQNSISLAALLRAVQECRLKPLGDPQRIIVLLAPAGFGLPLVFRQELRQRGAVLLHAGPVLEKRLQILKMLANRTRVVPLLMSSVEAWRDWVRRRSLESAQIRRRTFMVVELQAPASANPIPTALAEEN